MVPFEQDAWEQIMKAVPGQPLFDPALAVPSSDDESEQDQAADDTVEAAADANKEQENTQGTAGMIKFHLPELKEGTTYVARVSAYNQRGYSDHSDVSDSFEIITKAQFLQQEREKQMKQLLG